MDAGLAIDGADRSLAELAFVSPARQAVDLALRVAEVGSGCLKSKKATFASNLGRFISQ